MELVTGHQAGPHITAAQVSRFIQGITVMDDTTVYRLNEGNNCAITTTDLNLTIDTGEMVLHGFHVTNETPYDIGIDPVSDASKTRIDKIVLEITEDMTTGIQTASVVVVQGTEATSPVPPATPSTPGSPTEIFLGVGVIAQVTATDSTISVLTDLTELYAGSYVSKEDFDTGMSNIAPIEETSTASRPYSVGDHLIYNGVLYNVSANIAQGATLVPSGNISLSPDVEAQIGALNSALTGEEVVSYRQAPTTETTYTFDSKGHSKLCVCVGWSGGSLSNCQIFPLRVLLWKDNHIFLNGIQNTSPSYYLQIKNLDATSIKVIANNSNVWFLVLALD